jgi:23S rRNA pseudouridine1911/1915/1917 synthase
LNSHIHQFIFIDDLPDRLDKYLARMVADLSRSRIQGLIRDGFVLVNSERVSKTGLTLNNGDEVVLEIPPPVPTNLMPEDIPLDIVFENQDLLVINKPAGMVVHPSAGHSSGTLVHAVLAHVPQIEGVGGEIRPGVVHRLDKDTSGLILIAKNERAHRWLQNQFRLRKVGKIYLALVDGHPPTPTGRIEAPIGRDPVDRKKMAVLPVGKGREAISEYRTLQNFKNHTLIEVHLLTGRTHQVRLHMAFLNCPLVGDKIYGYRHSSLPIERHFLHAAHLTILLPGEQEPRSFTAELPEELENILKNLD